MDGVQLSISLIGNSLGDSDSQPGWGVLAF